MYLLARRLVIFLPSVFVFLFQLIVRIVLSGLNKRSPFGLAWTFFIGFLPVAIWLAIFKNAGLIPIDIRPEIHVPLAYHLDRFMYNANYSILGSVLTIIGTSVLGGLLYFSLFIGSKAQLIASPGSENFLSEDGIPSPVASLETRTDLSSSSSFDDDIELLDLDETGTTAAAALVRAQPNNNKWFDKFNFIPKMSATDASETNRKVHARIKSSLISPEETANSWGVRGLFKHAPSHLMILSYFLLNFAQLMAMPITHTKDNVAWLSYVVGHFCYPLFTAIWLYVFHAPGAVRLFGLALGVQNIAGVLTHLSMPTAPPWFIHRDGENGIASYETLGYAAGLTRTDFKVGTFSAQDGFHLSPIVFGAVPSLHSAMVVLCYFFVSHYSKWLFARALLLSAALLQWWATIYLDHHWRLDLFVGMIYACISYTAVYWFGIRYIDAKFISARLSGDFAEGSTMGMRVFRNTKLQNFFDPLI